MYSSYNPQLYTTHIPVYGSRVFLTPVPNQQFVVSQVPMPTQVPTYPSQIPVRNEMHLTSQMPVPNQMCHPSQMPFSNSMTVPNQTPSPSQMSVPSGKSHSNQMPATNHMSFPVIPQASPLYYNWYVATPSTVTAHSTRGSYDDGDDVFVFDGPVSSQKSSSSSSSCDDVFEPPTPTCLDDALLEAVERYHRSDSPESVRAKRNLGHSTGNGSIHSSPCSENGFSHSSIESSSPQILFESSEDPHIFSATSSPKPKNGFPLEDTLSNVFSMSFYKALNEDPPEPEYETCQKASLPKSESKSLVNLTEFGKVRSQMLTSTASERCPRFSQNGMTLDLDDCDKISLQMSEDSSGEKQLRSRELFLRTLETERERQRRCVLPKYAPKMMCKFCKNNGEDPEVYTKHRLHYNEKTVCPLLRHYICKLCNSTGDFAHTIRHCPFNTRYDKLAWKATFL